MTMIDPHSRLQKVEIRATGVCVCVRTESGFDDSEAEKSFAFHANLKNNFTPGNQSKVAHLQSCCKIVGASQVSRHE